MAKKKNQELTTELISNAKAGDSKAKNQLVTWVTNFICPIINVSPLRTHDRRSDISQEVAIKIIDRLDSFEGITPNNFEKWVFVITRNAVNQSMRHARQDKRNINHVDPIEQFFPEGVIVDQKSQSNMFADQQNVEKIMGILWDPTKVDADHREVIILRLLYKFPVARVGRRLQITEAAVDSRFRRALENLRKRYAADVGQKPGKTTRVARDKRAVAFLEYIRRCDAGKTVDIDAFLVEMGQTDDELRATLEMIEQLRQRGFGGDNDDDEDA